MHTNEYDFLELVNEVTNDGSFFLPFLVNLVLYK